ncbi:Ubiquitin carboxyl-terminal hydrolase family protein [Perilla frutescens var. frutescens]|nr:Ubiquitin carboxyl-terminal hydrolase family protein [Perilla frutescens var. frutescens]
MMFHPRPNFNSAVSVAAYFHPFIKIQARNLVNVKLKWVKDSILDPVVSGSVHLKATCTLASLIASDPNLALPIHRLSRHRRLLGLPSDLKLSTFIRRYPNIFQEFHRPDSSGTPVPWYRLSPEASNVCSQEMRMVCEDGYIDILNRLQKLLMLTRERLLPLQTIDQLRWDLGLPHDYEDKFVGKHPELFSFVKLPDDRMGLKLLVWDDRLAVSHLESNNLEKNESLTFPIGFTRGFGLKKKCMEWLNEWQKLPYTSPYVDALHLDPRTDVSEKRHVGVFHELLHLTILRKIERKNVSNLRVPLAMPQKFTKVFERHPGIFYISKKGATQTVVLREAFDRGQLIEKHPLADIWEKYANMMKSGFLDRSRGLYKNERNEVNIPSGGRRSSVTNLLAAIYSPEGMIPKTFGTFGSKEKLDLNEIDPTDDFEEGMSSLENPYMLSTLAPRRRIGDESSSFWPSFIVGDTLRIVFQNLLLESNEEILQFSERYVFEPVWKGLTSFSGVQRQSDLHITVSALLADAVVWMSELPAKLNPIILPIMSSIKSEQEEILQINAAESSAELIYHCMGRKPCPNDKLIKNLCTLACMDPCETPKAGDLSSVELIED